MSRPARFTYKMAGVDITKHALVPKHSMCSEKEKKELLDKYGLALESLPRMFASDPMSVALNAKEGDVVKIVRPSLTAGETVFYRRVVHG